MSVNMTEIITEATRIAKIHLPETAQHVADMSDAFVNVLDRDMCRFVSLMIDDARDESSDYFCNLPHDEYSRRYDALHSLLMTMMYPVVMSAVNAS